jgi:hypothetical protein
VPTSSGVFARTIRALQPYTGEIVFIGGWVHALYLAEANSRDRPIRTEDIDVTIPNQLLARDRPALLELVAAAGYVIQEVIDGSGIMEIFQAGPGQSLIELDLLTEAPDPMQDIIINGQPDLKVHGYPGQHVLLDNARWISVGADIHETLDPPVQIRVPRISAYTLGKGLSSQTRTRLPKQAKDLVYLFEIVRHPDLGRQVVDGMGEMAGKYPQEYARWRSYLAEAIDSVTLRREVVEQLILGFRALGSPEEVDRMFAARLRRLLGETPGSRRGQ